MQNGYTDLLIGMSKTGLNNQKKEENDHYDENGLLICGRCGCKKQAFIKTAAFGEEKTIKVAVTCKCDEERVAERKKREEEERLKELTKKMRRMSLMDAKYESASFDNCVTTEYNSQNFKLCRSYVKRFEEMMRKNQGMLMFGNVGTGKSYAAACIANELLNRNIPVVMTSFVKMLAALSNYDEHAEEMMQLLNNANLVIFDDLGAERKTDYALEKVYDIIDNRYRSNKPMIVTTNLTLEEMSSEVDIRLKRIYDRLFETCYPMQFTGPSWRESKMAANWNSMQKFLEG